MCVARRRIEELELERDTLESAAAKALDQRDKYKAKIAELEEELDRFKNGYQGGCYACEIVGEKNVALEAENQRLRELMEELIFDLDDWGGDTTKAKAALLREEDSE